MVVTRVYLIYLRGSDMAEICVYIFRVHVEGTGMSQIRVSLWYRRRHWEGSPALWSKDDGRSGKGVSVRACVCVCGGGRGAAEGPSLPPPPTPPPVTKPPGMPHVTGVTAKDRWPTPYLKDIFFFPKLRRILPRGIPILSRWRGLDTGRYGVVTPTNPRLLFL